MIPSFMSEIVGHPRFLIGLASILYKSSSILKSKNIVHPWHMAKYSSTSPISHVLKKIPLTSTRYSWKDSLGLTYSHSQDIIPQSHLFKIHIFAFGCKQDKMNQDNYFKQRLCMSLLPKNYIFIQMNFWMKILQVVIKNIYNCPNTWHFIWTTCHDFHGGKT